MGKDVITYEYGASLYVNATNRCDLACDFCLRRHGDSVGGSDSLWLSREPTREEILSSIMARDWNRYDQLVFCGYGEPAYRLEDICAVIDDLHEADFDLPIRIDTNGTANLIWGYDTVPLFAGRFDVVSVSLNDADEARYNARCHPKYPGAYQAMLDFTRAVVQVVPVVKMTVVDNIPPEEIEACRQICEGLGAVYRVRQYQEKW